MNHYTAAFRFICPIFLVIVTADTANADGATLPPDWQSLETNELTDLIGQMDLHTLSVSDQREVMEYSWSQYLHDRSSQLRLADQQLITLINALEGWLGDQRRLALRNDLLDRFGAHPNSILSLNLEDIILLWRLGSPEGKTWVPILSSETTAGWLNDWIRGADLSGLNLQQEIAELLGAVDESSRYSEMSDADVKLKDYVEGLFAENPDWIMTVDPWSLIAVIRWGLSDSALALRLAELQTAFQANIIDKPSTYREFGTWDIYHLRIAGERINISAVTLAGVLTDWITSGTAWRSSDAQQTAAILSWLIDASHYTNTDMAFDKITDLVKSRPYDGDWWSHAAITDVLTILDYITLNGLSTEETTLFRTLLRSRLFDTPQVLRQYNVGYLSQAKSVSERVRIPPSEYALLVQDWIENTDYWMIETPNDITSAYYRVREVEEYIDPTDAYARLATLIADRSLLDVDWLQDTDLLTLVNMTKVIERRLAPDQHSDVVRAFNHRLVNGPEMMGEHWQYQLIFGIYDTVEARTELEALLIGHDGALRRNVGRILSCVHEGSDALHDWRAFLVQRAEDETPPYDERASWYLLRADAASPALQPGDQSGVSGLEWAAQAESIAESEELRFAAVEWVLKERIRTGELDAAISHLDSSREQFADPLHLDQITRWQRQVTAKMQEVVASQ